MCGFDDIYTIFWPTLMVALVGCYFCGSEIKVTSLGLEIGLLERKLAGVTVY